MSALESANAEIEDLKIALEEVEPSEDGYEEGYLRGYKESIAYNHGLAQAQQADPWEDGTLGRSPEHAKRAPQELQDKINASLKEGK